MTLKEAIVVFFPDGPLTLPSLRTAIRSGQLAAVSVAGKLLTTPASLREMLRPRAAPQQVRHDDVDEVNGRAAQEAVRIKLERLARFHRRSR